MTAQSCLKADTVWDGPNILRNQRILVGEMGSWQDMLIVTVVKFMKHSLSVPPSGERRN